MEPLPPYLEPDAVDEEAERVVSALMRIGGRPPWSISNDREAAWVMGKLAAASREINEAEALAAEYRERIATWLYDRTRGAMSTRSWAEALLCRYLEDLHAADPKVKSRRLPDGRISSTEGRVQWEVVDEDAAIKALTDAGLGELVVTSVAGPQALAKLLLADQDKGRAITADGIVVDGIVVGRRPRTYKATPA